MDKEKRSEYFDFVGAFEQGWIQYSANIFKLIPYGFMAALPVIVLNFELYTGIAFIVALEGIFLLFLADAVYATANIEEPELIDRVKENWKRYLKQGFILSIFLMPLIIGGAILFIFPAILFFAFFIFSFLFVVRKNKFSVDACMEVLRLGKGFRLHIFLLSMIMVSSMALIYLFSAFIIEMPFLFVVMAMFLLPYFFYVIQEFFEQLEIK